MTPSSCYCLPDLSLLVAVQSSSGTQVQVLINSASGDAQQAQNAIQTAVNDGQLSQALQSNGVPVSGVTTSSSNQTPTQGPRCPEDSPAPKQNLHSMHLHCTGGRRVGMQPPCTHRGSGWGGHCSTSGESVSLTLLACHGGLLAWCHRPAQRGQAGEGPAVQQGSMSVLPCLPVMRCCRLALELLGVCHSI